MNSEWQMRMRMYTYFIKSILMLFSMLSIGRRELIIILINNGSTIEDRNIIIIRLWLITLLWQYTLMACFELIFYFIIDKVGFHSGGQFDSINSYACEGNTTLRESKTNN